MQQLQAMNTGIGPQGTPAMSADEYLRRSQIFAPRGIAAPAPRVACISVRRARRFEGWCAPDSLWADKDRRAPAVVLTARGFIVPRDEL